MLLGVLAWPCSVLPCRRRRWPQAAADATICPTSAARPPRAVARRRIPHRPAGRAPAARRRPDHRRPGGHRIPAGARARASSRQATRRFAQRFPFFFVRDDTINAFALPGGFIGVNYGLVLATRNEAQLAGVLAHEIAHVTQRHIARRVRSQGRASIATMAAILAAILVGAATGSGDAAMGGIAMAQGAAMQQQINFTRANENEADRVGMGFLAAAGFDPYGMPDFFETMGRRTQLGPDQRCRKSCSRTRSPPTASPSRARAPRSSRRSGCRERELLADARTAARARHAGGEERARLLRIDARRTAGCLASPRLRRALASSRRATPPQRDRRPRAAARGTTRACCSPTALGQAQLAAGDVKRPLATSSGRAACRRATCR